MFSLLPYPCVPDKYILSQSLQIFQRANTTACEPYTPNIRGWCDTGDIYCDHGNVTGVHGSYFNNYTTTAAEFIVRRFNESQAQASPTASSTPSPSATAVTGKNGAGSSRPASTGVVVSCVAVLVGGLLGVL